MIKQLFDFSNKLKIVKTFKTFFAKYIVVF